MDKINFIKCLIEARKSVTPRTIRHGWAITGNYPISRAKALAHPEIQPDAPEKTTIYDPTAAPEPKSDDEADPVNRQFIVRLAEPHDGNRQKKSEARRVADLMAESSAQIAFLQQRVQQLEELLEAKSKSKKRKAAPPAYGKKFSSAARLLAKGYTIEALNEDTGKLKASRAHKLARSTLVLK